MAQPEGQGEASKATTQTEGFCPAAGAAGHFHGATISVLLGDIPSALSGERIWSEPALCGAVGGGARSPPSAARCGCAAGATGGGAFSTHTVGRDLTQLAPQRRPPGPSAAWGSSLCSDRGSGSTSASPSGRTRLCSSRTGPTPRGGSSS